ncbi:hypothetical protein BT93_A2142 [Corymbia citriodora subsp. variegata]|nr:hypothetical protein BT93_A2142 [Corymbia citriodora subsp. variegata]
MSAQKAVLKLDVHDENCKKKAMKIASKFAGVESIAMDMKDQKLTVAGTMDPVKLAEKLRKRFSAEIVSVGPAKEPPKKEPPKPDPPKPDPPIIYLPPYYPVYYQPLPSSLWCCNAGFVSIEEDPNASCVIC